MTSLAGPGPVAQTRALLALRWQMIRTPGVKVGLAVALLLTCWLVVTALRSVGAVDAEALATAVELAPEAFLGFAALAVIAPLSAGGGLQVVPAEQLVAFPVRPGTAFLGGLALAPANLVWALQVVVLAAETAYLTTPGHLAPGLLTTAAFLVLVTASGQAFAWTLVGLRASRIGRRVVVAAALTLVAAIAVVARLGLADDALHASPTRTVVAGVAAGGSGDWARWGLTTGVLALLAVTALVLGRAAGRCVGRRTPVPAPRAEASGAAAPGTAPCASWWPWTGRACGGRPPCAAAAWSWRCCPGSPPSSRS